MVSVDPLKLASAGQTEIETAPAGIGATKWMPQQHSGALLDFRRFVYKGVENVPHVSVLLS